MLSGASKSLLERCDPRLYRLLVEDRAITDGRDLNGAFRKAEAPLRPKDRARQGILYLLMIQLNSHPSPSRVQPFPLPS